MFLKRLLSSIIFLILFIILIVFLFWFFGINNIENSDRQALISAIVTIFVFGAGLIVRMIGNKIKQLQKDKQLKRIFIQNLKTILKGLKFQIDNYTQVIEILKSPTPEDAMISSYAELEYFEINRIGSEDLFRIFIDYQKGNKEHKIDILENLRKELRFIEYSKDIIITDFKNLYSSIREYSDTVITGIIELGMFFDKEATRLLHNNVEMETDGWFVSFTNLWSEIRSASKISEDTYMNYEKLEMEIIPKFFDFARDNIKEPRTPIVTAAFSKANSAIFQRKGTIKNLINFMKFYTTKYEETKDIIEKSLDEYEK